jgi:hypothetical protein
MSMAAPVPAVQPPAARLPGRQRLPGRGKMGKTALASMGTLADKLTSSENRPKVVAACVDLVESEVAAKKGFSGAAVKAGYKVVKTLKPGMVANVVDKLLPEWADALQPIFDENEQDADRFCAHLNGKPEQAADALLSVTDSKAENADNKTLKKTYERLRGTAKDNVAAAVPGLASTLRPWL